MDRSGIILRIPVIFLIGVALCCPDEARAQEDEELEDEFALLEEEEEEIVFSAARHAQPIADSPSTITVITREEILNTHCVDVTCLLRQVPEVEVRRVRPMYHSVGARALAGEMSDKGLVLVDGREINVEAFGNPLWATLPVHLEDIERIEVIRGPGSALYGANAHSLVISITTRRPDSDEAEVFLGGGEYDESSLHVRLGKVLGDWRFQFSGGRETSGHWRIPDRRERELYRAWLRVERERESSVTSLAAGWSSIEGTLFSGLAPIGVDNANVVHTSLAHRTDLLRAHLWFSLFSADLNFDLPLFFEGSKLGTVPEVTRILTTNLDSEVQLNWSPFDGNLLIAGTNYRWLTYFSDDNEPKETHQHRVGLFVQDEQRLWDQLILTGGLRFDYNSITPYTFSPRLAVVWRFTADQLIRLAFGRAFRKPSFFNTSFHPATVKGEGLTPKLGDFFKHSIGNDDLDNESITTFELGFRGRFLDGALTVEADGFFNLYRDTISFKTDIEPHPLLEGLPDLTCSDDEDPPCKTVLRFENEGRDVDSAGGSIAVRFRPWRWLRLTANYTYRYSWFIADASLGDDPDVRKAGDRVEWEPAHLVNASIHYLSGFGLRLGLAMYARSGFTQRVAADGSVFGELEPVSEPARIYANSYIAWRVESGERWIEAGLRATNMFGQGLRDTCSVIRSDDVEIGGHLQGRRILLFLRGGV